MKFSHLNLEKIRQSPADVKAILAGGNGRMSMNRVWTFAARKYHQTGGDRNFALNYFEESFDRNFASNDKNRAKKEELLLKLENYITEYLSLGIAFYDYPIRITIDINHGNLLMVSCFGSIKRLIMDI